MSINNALIGNLGNGNALIGKSASVLDFDGVNDFVDTNYILNFERTDTFEFEGWVYFNSKSGTQIIIENLDPSTTFRGFNIVLNPNGLGFYLNNDNLSNNRLDAIAPLSSVPLQKWFHLVIMYNGSSDASGISIFIDGINQSLTRFNNLSGTISNNNNAFLGKRHSNNSFFFNGKLSNIKIKVNDNIVRWYKFTETTGSTLHDSISGGTVTNSGFTGTTNGTINGAVWENNVSGLNYGAFDIIEAFYPVFGQIASSSSARPAYQNLVLNSTEYTFKMKFIDFGGSSGRLLRTVSNGIANGLFYITASAGNISVTISDGDSISTTFSAIAIYNLNEETELVVSLRINGSNLEVYIIANNVIESGSTPTLQTDLSYINAGIAARDWYINGESSGGAILTGLVYDFETFSNFTSNGDVTNLTRTNYIPLYSLDSVNYNHIYGVSEGTMTYENGGTSVPISKFPETGLTQTLNEEYLNNYNGVILPRDLSADILVDLSGNTFTKSSIFDDNVQIGFNFIGKQYISANDKFDYPNFTLLFKLDGNYYGTGLTQTILDGTDGNNDGVLIQLIGQTLRVKINSDINDFTLPRTATTQQITIAVNSTNIDLRVDGDYVSRLANSGGTINVTNNYVLGATQSETNYLYNNLINIKLSPKYLSGVAIKNLEDYFNLGKPNGLSTVIVNNTDFKLTWNTDQNKSYQYEVWKKYSGGTYQKIVTTRNKFYTDTSLNLGDNVTYKVRIIFGRYHSRFSSELNVEVLNLILDPTDSTNNENALIFDSGLNATNATAYSANALDYDGVNDEFDTGEQLTFDRGNTLVYESYYKLPVDSTYYDLIETQNSSVYKGLIIGKNESDQIFFKLVADTSTNDQLEVRTNTTIPNDEWFKLTIGYSGTSLASGVKIYYNDIEQATTTVADNLSSSIQTTNNLKLTYLPKPVAPSTLVATVLSDTEIAFTFTDLSNNEDGFKLYMSTGSSVQITGSNYVTSGATGVTGLTATSLTENTTYYAVVVAFNEAGNSTKSNEVSATTFEVFNIEAANDNNENALILEI